MWRVRLVKRLLLIEGNEKSKTRNRKAEILKKKGATQREARKEKKRSEKTKGKKENRNEGRPERVRKVVDQLL